MKWELGKPQSEGLSVTIRSINRRYIVNIIPLESVKTELQFCIDNRVDTTDLSADYVDVVRQCRSKSNANICCRGIGGAKSFVPMRIKDVAIWATQFNNIGAA